MTRDNSTNLGALSFQYLISSEMFFFFDVEDNGTLVEYAYSFFKIHF